jgi:xylan 1,4-beta-xylosidase
MKHTVLTYILLLCFRISFSQSSPVSLRVDASKSIGDMKPFWSFFGYNQPNHTHRENGIELLTELKQVSHVTISNSTDMVNFLMNNKL